MDKQMSTLALCLLLSCGLAAAASPRKLSSDCSTPPPPKKMCLCDNTKIQPVCGANGLTYMTPCEADCADVKWKPGPCLNGIVGQEPPQQPPAMCLIKCPNVFVPVCGENGVTYPNQCFAQCAGQRKWTEGRCASDCVCPNVNKPVCGYDGKTYPNACEALCQGTYVRYNGTCQPMSQAISTDAGCPDIYLPVCSDNKTYPNACVARLNHVTSYTSGPCPNSEPLPPCGCPPILAPVCGQNNVTYTNKCFAECGHQTTVAYSHPCTDQCAPLNGVCLLEPVILPWNEIPKHQPCCAGSECVPMSGSAPLGRLWGVCAPIVYK